MVLRRARGYAPLPIHLKTPLPCVLAVGAHLKNTVALERRAGGLHQPAHRRSRNERGPRGLSRGRGGPAPALRRDARGRRVRPASRLSFDQIRRATGRADRCSAASRPASLGACAFLHGGKRSRVSRARRGVGRHRLRHRRHDLGRRISAGRARSRSSASRTSASSGCPAARPRSSNRAAPRSAFSTRSGERKRSTTAISRPCAIFPTGDLALIRQMLVKELQSPRHLQRGPAVRRRRVADRPAPASRALKARRRWNSSSRSSRASARPIPSRSRALRASHHRLAPDDRGNPGRRPATA